MYKKTDPLEDVRNQSKALEYAPIVKSNLSVLEGVDGQLQVPLVDVYVTDACNLRCHFCPTDFGQTFLPIEAISQINRLSPRVITLTGGGEPSIYSYRGKKILDVIDGIRSTMGKIPLGMMTNGTARMDAQAVSELDWLRVSINGYDRKSYQQVHGRDVFPKVIQHLIHYLQTPIKKIGVGFVYTEETAAFIVQFVERILSEISAHISPEQLAKLTVQFRPVAYQDYRRFQLTAQTVEQIRTKIACVNSTTKKFLEEQTNIAQVLENNCFQCGGQFDKCHVSLLQMNINPNGDAYPCPQKAHSEQDSHGNILDTDFFHNLRRRINHSFHNHTSQSCPNCAQTKINCEYEKVDLSEVDTNTEPKPVFF